MKKVIGFDSWTGGAINWEPLARRFTEVGVAFHVVHIGSWGGDPGRPEVERVGSIEFRDILHYRTNALREVLTAEQPDAVLFLSTDTFAHRAFNRYCRLLGIPTVHVYHGLISVQDTTATKQYRMNAWAQLWFVLARIPKALRYIWPTYLASLIAAKAPLADWKRFANDIVNGALGRYAPVSAPDARADRCCVYTLADSDHAIQKYGFCEDQVFAVGNPDLDRFGLTAEAIASALRRTKDELFSDVMYIDTGLVHTGFVFNSIDDFVQHLVETKRQLEKLGKRLVLKLHPDHFRTNIPQLLTDAGIDICQNDTFVARLRGCCACIVEPSTLSIIPALMGLPLFMARYGRLKQQRYGRALVSYPRAVELDDISRIDELLSMMCNEQADARSKRWIETNAGPLPASQMPARVVTIVEEIVGG